MRWWVGTVAPVVFVTACTASYGEGAPAPPSATEDSTTLPDVGAPPPPPSAPKPPAKDAGTGHSAPSETCPSAVVTGAIWHPPPGTQQACTRGDIDFFITQSTSAASAPAMETAMRDRNQTCATCLFSHYEDPSWKAILYVDDQGTAILNYTACMARAPGGTESCAKATFDETSCGGDVCASCSTSDASGACWTKVQADPSSCGRYDMNGACGGADALGRLYASCSDLRTAATVLCGGT